MDGWSRSSSSTSQRGAEVDESIFFLLPTQKKEKGKSQVKRLTRDFFTLFFSLTLATRRHLAVGIEGSKSGFFKFVSLFSTTRLQIPPKQMIIKMNK